MISLDISGRNFEVDPKLANYVSEKIGSLDRFLPKHVRETVYGAVMLHQDESQRQDNQFVCQADITLQGGKLHSKEGTVNMYAAVDIVEAKLKAQMLTYKEKHTTEPRRAKMMTRLMGRTSETDPQTPENELVQ